MLIISNNESRLIENTTLFLFILFLFNWIEKYKYTKNTCIRFFYCDNRTHRALRV